MISHEHKCIFIHIPRTGGTSIETAICGKNWWKIDPLTKHLTASKTKEIYKEYWDYYFKFSFIRNPWDKIVSLYHTGYFNGDLLENPPISQRDLSLFDSFYEKDNVFFVKTKSIGVSSGLGLNYFIDNYKAPPWEQQSLDYCEILDEDIDFIGKFENIKSDFYFVSKKIGLEIDIPYVDSVRRINKTKKYLSYYDEFSIKKVENIFAKTIDKYKYHTHDGYIFL